MRVLAILLGFLIAAAAQAGPLRSGATIAYFDLIYIDTSTEGAYSGVNEAETRRLKMLSDYVVEEFTKRGFEFVDIAPVQKEIDRIASPADCNGCAVLMARKLGADYAMVGEVQKVSNLILSMNLLVRDSETGVLERGLAVDIRSNTDDSWRRGMRYIIRRNIFKEEGG